MGSLAWNSAHRRPPPRATRRRVRSPCGAESSGVPLVRRWSPVGSLVTTGLPVVAQSGEVPNSALSGSLPQPADVSASAVAAAHAAMVVVARRTAAESRKVRRRASLGSTRRMSIGSVAVRGLVGPLFVGHGTQKLFGWFGGHGLEGTGGFFGGGGPRAGRRHAVGAGGGGGR